MFGSKKAKQARLAQEVQVIRQRGEVTQVELAHAVGTSVDTVEDDLVTLEDQNVKLCQKGQKISLLESWFGSK